MEFKRPSQLIDKENRFGDREVGITHPDISSFMRFADNGDIYIMAQEGLGIIISAAQNCIFLVGDHVKFLTKEDEGLRWNNLAFNPKAVKYSEPSLIYPKKQSTGIYDGMADFLD